MLLVVKRGAGRLPPDRVSLYDRAIEVLLDTWNIKGHEPLNLKEAVPQLACVAFELMQQGQQTATEKELLTILEQARDRLPQIKRYAIDRPDQFLRRVELRSSLLVEAGHQLDGIHTVPFYQFRHLTFQEHLAAVAAVGGHYLSYEKDDTLLMPLKPYLLTDEWKEVIPMAAVLAKKQSEPLMAELVSHGRQARALAESAANSDFEEPYKLPPAVSRLVQCLAEEAEASPETLTVALQLIALFARGCRPPESWAELARGPYGKELIHQAWLIYSPMDWPRWAWVRNTLAVLLAMQHPESYWCSSDAETDLHRLLRSSDREEIVYGRLSLAGLQWGWLSSGTVPTVRSTPRWYLPSP